MSPIQYQKQLRLQEARRLLPETLVVAEPLGRARGLPLASVGHRADRPRAVNRPEALQSDAIHVTVVRCCIIPDSIRNQ